MIVDFIGAAWARSTDTGESLATAAVRLVSLNHRRYGGHVVHAGMGLVVLGIAASSLYRIESQQTVLRPGESMDVGPAKITVQSINDIKGPNYTGTEARLVAALPSGEEAQLRPQIHWYPKSTDRAGNPQAVSKVSIHSGLTRDLWVVMAADAQGVCSFKVLVLPLLAWIWVGSIVLGLGTVVCLLPRSSTAAEAAEAPAAATSRLRPSRARAARQVA